MSVTMRDVAARAGVTPTVVSRVLHNKATAIRVSEATAERVRQAAVDLGYRVNIMARSFRERQTMMIGVLHGIGFERPLFNNGSRYFAALMDGIVEGAFAHNYSVTLCPTLLGQTPEDAMSDGRFDGLVWYSTLPSEENQRMLQQCSLPMVLIHTRAAVYGNRYPSVICDNEQGIGLAVDHLLELGHRKIAFTYNKSVPFTESVVRADAFRTRLEAHGFAVRESDFIDEQDLASYLEQGPRHTAILAHNEGLAAELLELARQCSIHVPHDLSVIGFDSTSFCDEQTPKLTSVHQPLAEMGKGAIDLLVQTISAPKSPPEERIYPCRLDLRRSTAPPAC
jgi:DNA-binding LacI/PurR family transcriptional regulator